MNMRRSSSLLQLLLVPLVAACSPAVPAATGSAPGATSWWKGNLHTHSLWSDGADYPEMIAAWYRDHGYNFVAITEHDRLQSGEMWVTINAPDAGWPPRNASARAALPGYRSAFGGAWVQEQGEGAAHRVRLRGLDEYRSRFEVPGSFLLVMAEEITDSEGSHVNVLNPAAAIQPAGGATTIARTRANLEAVEQQRVASGRPMLAIVNHPNFVWSLTAEDIAATPRARLFELRSGHTMVNDAGTAHRAGTERIWDVILSLRHAAGGGPIYGVGADDAHDYRAEHDTISRPGRAWVMVRSRALSPDALIPAMLAGDFYTSTGVTLRDVQSDARGMRIDIAAEPGVTYRTQFIGTRRSASLQGEPVDSAGVVLRTTRRYGDDVGAVLAEVDGASAAYTFRGDERYVRATITSSRMQRDPVGGYSMHRPEGAWVQPVFLPR